VDVPVRVALAGLAQVPRLARLVQHRLMGSRYRSGRTGDWLKFKNPAAPAVQREAEEDWDRGRRWRRLGPPSSGA
jgi:hypothetical protein